jgi:hypothetical protein
MGGKAPRTSVSQVLALELADIALLDLQVV